MANNINNILSSMYLILDNLTDKVTHNNGDIILMSSYIMENEDILTSAIENFNNQTVISAITINNNTYIPQNGAVTIQNMLPITGRQVNGNVTVNGDLKIPIDGQLSSLADVFGAMNSLLQEINQ